VPYLPGLSAETLSFTRDGKRMAYVTYPEGSVWISGSDGSARRQLTFPPMQSYQPRWSPDDKQIVFSGLAEHHHSHIFLVSAEGGAPRQLTFAGWYETDPTWSPDGKWVAFSENPVMDFRSGPRAYGPIRTVDISTHQVSTLPGSEDIWGPCWSPNGRYIAANKGSREQLVVFDTTTQRWVWGGLEPIGWLAWSRDSELLYADAVTQEGYYVYRLRMSTGKLERIASLKNVRLAGQLGGWTGLTQDDAPLVLRDIGTQDIYAFDWEAP